MPSLFKNCKKQIPHNFRQIILIREMSLEFDGKKLRTSKVISVYFYTQRNPGDW